MTAELIYTIIMFLMGIVMTVLGVKYNHSEKTFLMLEPPEWTIMGVICILLFGFVLIGNIPMSWLT